MNIEITIKVPSGAGGGVTLSNGETSVDASALLTPPLFDALGESASAPDLPGPPDLDALSTFAGEDESASLSPPSPDELLAATNEAGSDFLGPPSPEEFNPEAGQAGDGTEKSASKGKGRRKA